MKECAELARHDPFHSPKRTARARALKLLQGHFLLPKQPPQPTGQDGDYWICTSVNYGFLHSLFVHEGFLGFESMIRRAPEAHVALPAWRGSRRPQPCREPLGDPSAGRWQCPVPGERSRWTTHDWQNEPPYARGPKVRGAGPRATVRVKTSNSQQFRSIQHLTHKLARRGFRLSGKFRPFPG